MAEIEIIGSVAPQEVPTQRRENNWSRLAERVVRDHEEGRVTVLRLTDEEDLVRLRGNLGHHLHRKDYSARTVVVRQGDPIEIRVFVELVPYTPNKNHREN
jgi:hypothetical protein